MDNAQGTNEQLIVSSLPAPPVYYQLYDPHSNFIPPEPPAAIVGTYSMYGQVYTTEDILPTLEDQGRIQLYPKLPVIDHISELKKLNRSLLFKFLELIDFIIYNPIEYKSKVDDIELLFINMCHLLNGYRPHQARQIVISLIEHQVQQRKDTIVNLQSTLKQAEDLIDKSKKTLQDTTTINIDLNDINNSNTSNVASNLVEPSPSTTVDSSSSTSPQTNFINKMLHILDSIEDVVE